MQAKASVNAFASEEFVPVEAVVFYAPRSKAGSELTFATIHGVAIHGNDQRLKEGRPITIEAMKKVSQMFGEALKVKPTILREQVLFSSDDLLVWWTRPMRRLCFFDIDWHAGQPGRDRLQGVSAMLPMPPLVWCLKRTAGKGIWQGMKIWALAEDKRPTESTPLYRAPLLNLDEDGRVCWGSGKVPKKRTQQDIAEWEDAFFSSVFSHYNESMPFKGSEGYTALADLVEASPETFPVDLLIPMKQTLSAALAEEV